MVEAGLLTVPPIVIGQILPARLLALSPYLCLPVLNASALTPQPR